MVCAIGNEQGEILKRVSIPTETPDITMPKLAEFFSGQGIGALGIGCFGPIDLNRDSETYGYITTTPKLPWKYFDICGYFRKALDIPVGFDTDVNGSMLGEATWGCAKGLDSAIYITVGTGVGVGIMADGKLLHGMLHPEGVTSLCPSALTIPTRENVLTTKHVWKVWPPVLLSRPGGARLPKTWRTGLRCGIWRLITWPTLWLIIL